MDVTYHMETSKNSMKAPKCCFSRCIKVEIGLF